MLTRNRSTQGSVYMRMALPVPLLCGLLTSQGVNAQEANIQQPRWVIVETIIDRATGKRVHVAELAEPYLAYQTIGRNNGGSGWVSTASDDAGRVGRSQASLPPRRFGHRRNRLATDGWGRCRTGNLRQLRDTA
jgi:hypothetical protein